MSAALLWAELAVKKPALAYAAELLNAVDGDDDDETATPIPVTIIIIIIPRRRPNCTGPPCSVLSATRPSTCPDRHQRYRRRQQMTTTDASEQNSTGPLGGPVTFNNNNNKECNGTGIRKSISTEQLPLLSLVEDKKS